MDLVRDRNVIGAFALMISDRIASAASAPVPDAGPTAAALALLSHVPGLSVRTLAAGVGLSHPGAVRLVDRLVEKGLVIRRDHATDGRTRSLYLTKAGAKASAAVLKGRDSIIAEELSALEPREVALLAALTERVLRARLTDLNHAYRICRLCGYSSCGQCPIEMELNERADGKSSTQSTRFSAASTVE